MKNKKNPDNKIETQSEVGQEQGESLEEKENVLKKMRDIFGANTEKHSYNMKSKETIALLRGEYKGEEAQEFINKRLGAGKEDDARVRLRGTEHTFFLTGSEAGGQFLTEEISGETAEERKENLQLPPENNAEDLYKVHLTSPRMVIESTVMPQEEWAQKAGYTPREGMKQIYVPTKFGDFTPVIEVLEQIEGKKPHKTQRPMPEENDRKNKDGEEEEN